MGGCQLGPEGSFRLVNLLNRAWKSAVSLARELDSVIEVLDSFLRPLDPEERQEQLECRQHEVVQRTATTAEQQVAGGHGQADQCGRAGIC